MRIAKGVAVDFDKPISNLDTQDDDELRRILGVLGIRGTSLRGTLWFIDETERAKSEGAPT